MKAERLIELMHHPEKMGNDDMRELGLLVDRYPYFQTARILFLKALYNSAGARFRNELKSSTVHLVDHKQLFKYLNNQIVFEASDPHANINASLSDIVDERIREIKGHTVVSSFGIPAFLQTGPEEEEIVNFDLRKKQANPDKQEVAVESEISEPAKLFRRFESDVNVISNPILLDDIPGVISDYSERENIRTSPEDTAYEIIPHHRINSYVIEAVKQEEPPAFSDTPETAGRKPASTILSMDIDLDDDETEDTGIRSVLETPEISSGAYRLTSGNVDSPGILPEKTTRKTRKKNELIEQFIQNEPVMPKITANAGVNPDLSKENPIMEEGLFSETLAKIYTKQHLYEKAVQTYIKLSLKYPEKSVYFANRIEKIKENTNNKE